MVRYPALVLALAALLPLGGCSWFSSDDEEATATEGAAQRAYVPVEAVRNIEIGRTRTGFAITAHGIAPALGYADAELRARRDGRPAADGFLDFDFVALPPLPELGYSTGAPEARAIRADLLIPANVLQGATGIRVHAAAGGMQITF